MDDAKLIEVDDAKVHHATKAPTRDSVQAALAQSEDTPWPNRAQRIRLASGSAAQPFFVAPSVDPSGLAFVPRGA